MRLGKRQRWIVSVLAVVAVILIAGGSGLPQRWLLEMALKDVLKSPRVEARGVSFLGQARVDSLRVFAAGQGAPDDTPMIRADNLHVTYDLSPMQRRHLQAVSLDTLYVTYDATRRGAQESRAPGNPRLGPETWYTGRWTPAALDIRRAGGAVILPWLGVSIDGATVQLATARGEQALTLAGDQITGEWWGAPDDSHRPIRGAIDVEVHWNQYRTFVNPFRIELGDLVSAHGTARVGGERRGTEFSIDLDDAHLGAMDLARAPGAWAAPVAFKGIQLSNVRARGDWGRGWLGDVAELALHGQAKDVRIGKPGAAFYEGDVSMDVHNSPGAGLQFHSELTLSKGQKMALDLGGGEAEVKAHIAFSNWNREQWTSLVPENLRPYLASVPALNQMTGSMDASYIVGGVYGKGTLTPSIGAGAAAVPRPIELEVVEPPFWSQEPCKVTAVLAFPEQKKESTIRVEYSAVSETGDMTTDVDLADIQLSSLFGSLGMVNYLDGCESTASGKASLHRSHDKALLEVDVKAAPFSWAGVALPADEPVLLTGQMSSSPSFENVAIRGFDLTLGKAGNVRVAEATVTASPWSLRGDAVAKLDLEKLSSYLRAAKVRGKADLKVPLTVTAKTVRAAVTGTATELAFGEESAVLDAPVSLKGEVTYDMVRHEIGVKGAAVRVGDGTAITVDGASMAAGSGPMKMPFTFSTDFDIFTRMGWLTTATGQAKAAGSLSRVDGALTGACDIDAQAESLALPDALAGFGGVRFKAHLTRAEAFGGSGLLRIANVAVSGATAHDVSGTLEFGANGVNIPDLVASVFGGTVKARLSAGILEAKRPLRLEGAVEALDLDAFTKEFKPPGATLTGMAHGSFLVELEGTTLADLKLTLHCGKGFSMNRDLVQELLVSGAVKGFTGAKTLEKVMNQVVGKAEQRPFDSVDLSLAYVESGLKGQAALRSKGLNLTIDLSVDPTALRAAIELRQQAQLDNVANIKAEPVQF